jgi:hypothetical protein
MVRVLWQERPYQIIDNVWFSGNLNFFNNADLLAELQIRGKWFDPVSRTVVVRCRIDSIQSGKMRIAMRYY